MTRYIVSMVIVVLAWAFAIFTNATWYYPLIVTAVVGLTLLIMFLTGKLRERRAARQLTKALQAQANEQASGARPDLQAEIVEMQGEFQKALDALGDSTKKGRKALYSLPWYTIIGPPGCGKSTALRSSGLEFPYLSASRGGIRGLGGTRNCDWWLTNEAVILDTAGRWTSEEEDRDEWLAFLDLLKKFRPQKPLNGVIAAVSVGDIGNAREHEVSAVAKRIRDRIDEVMGRLAMSLPVYVLFTKCDLIPGFVETYGNFAKQDRGQIWGFTAPLAKPIGKAGEYFSARFQELVQRCEYRSLKRMSEERKYSDRDLIFAHPQQLTVLHQNLQEFVNQLFQENVFKETPRMRGVYFTSGTQEGRPIDRVMHRMAEAFGQQQVDIPQPQVESKSYFLRNVFSNVVFKDSAIAVRSPKEILRQRRQTFLTAGLISLTALLMGALPGVAWFSNTSYLSSTQDAIEETENQVRAETTPVLNPTVIEPILERAQDPGEFFNGIPFLSFGLYQTNVDSQVEQYTLRLLRNRVVGPILTAQMREINQFGQRVAALGGNINGEQYSSELRKCYNTLKLHLLMTRPQSDLEPAHNDELKQFIIEQLSSAWATQLQLAHHDERHDQIQRQVRYYVEHLEEYPFLLFPRNAQSVGGTQRLLREVGNNDVILHYVVEQMESQPYRITLGSMLPGVTSMISDVGIRSAYTRAAWTERVSTMLNNEAHTFFEEQWVIGVTPPDNARQQELLLQRQVQQLRSLYFEQYVTEWRNFINAIQINTPHTDAAALALLEELTSGEPQQMTSLIRQVGHNVGLEDPNAPSTGTNSGSGLLGRTAQVLGQRAARRAGSDQALVRGAQGDLTRRAQQLTGANAPGALPPNLHDISWVGQQFTGFTSFAPLGSNGTQANSGSQAADVANNRQANPARAYEEALQFLEDALRQHINRSPLDTYGSDRTRLTQQTETQIQARSDAWQPRFRSLLMPPINGSVPLPAPTEGVPPTPPSP